MRGVLGIPARGGFYLVWWYFGSRRILYPRISLYFVFLCMRRPVGRAERQFAVSRVLPTAPLFPKWEGYLLAAHSCYNYRRRRSSLFFFYLPLSSYAISSTWKKSLPFLSPPNESPNFLLPPPPFELSSSPWGLSPPVVCLATWYMQGQPAQELWGSLIASSKRDRATA